MENESTVPLFTSDVKMSEIKAKRSRQSNYSAYDEVVLIQAVIRLYEDIFSNFRGSENGLERKENAWLEVTDSVNAVSLVKRSRDSVEKKFNAMKQSAKSKADEHKNPPTGGGHQRKLTQGEELWIEAMDAKRNPVIHGVLGGLDINERVSGEIVEDFQIEVEKLNHAVILDTIFQSTAVPSTINSTKDLPSTSQTTIAHTSTSHTTTDLPSTIHTTTSHKLSNLQPISSSSRLLKRKRKSNVDERDTLELELLTLERDRAKIELSLSQQKHDAFQRKLKLWDLKEKFYKHMLNES